MITSNAVKNGAFCHKTAGKTAGKTSCSGPAGELRFEYAPRQFGKQIAELTPSAAAFLRKRNGVKS